MANMPMPSMAFCASRCSESMERRRESKKGVVGILMKRDEGVNESLNGNVMRIV